MKLQSCGGAREFLPVCVEKVTPGTRNCLRVSLFWNLAVRDVIRFASFGCIVIWISIRTRTFSIGPEQQRFNLLFSCGYFVYMIDFSWSVSSSFSAWIMIVKKGYYSVGCFTVRVNE